MSQNPFGAPPGDGDNPFNFNDFLENPNIVNDTDLGGFGIPAGSTLQTSQLPNEQQGAFGQASGPQGLGQPAESSQAGGFGQPAGPGQAGGFGQPRSFGQPGSFGQQPSSFGQPGGSSQPASFSQPGSFGQPASIGQQPGAFGQPASFSQPGGFGQPTGFGSPSSFNQAGVSGQAQGSFSQPSAVPQHEPPPLPAPGDEGFDLNTWDPTPYIDDNDAEFQHYLQILDGIPLPPNEPASPAGDRLGPWQAQAPAAAWGPGVNGETIPESLGPLYNDIPAGFRTREYWYRLVDAGRSNPNITAQLWVDEMCKLLRAHGSNPAILFGWTQLSIDWRLFFRGAFGFFAPGNVNPTVWISMIRHFQTGHPHAWEYHRIGQGPPLAQRGQPGPTPATTSRPNSAQHPAPPGPGRRYQPIVPKPPTGGPGGAASNPVVPIPALGYQPGPYAGRGPGDYVPQYAPTIPTPADGIPWRPNLAAQGPIPPNYNITKKTFKGQWFKNPGFWGDFVDDGPQHDDEDEKEALIRQRWARFNMGIIQRPNERLPLLASRPSNKQEVVLKERDILSREARKRNATRGREHDNKMYPDRPGFDSRYQAKWRQQQRDRRAENSRRREAAYEHRARYYIHAGRPVPPRPAPPEDSDDDFFFDPGEPPALRPGREKATQENKWVSQRSRCEPCETAHLACSYKEKPLPCDNCVAAGIENRCMNLDPGARRTQLNGYPCAGLFIPSFALPPPLGNHEILGLDISNVNLKRSWTEAQEGQEPEPSTEIPDPNTGVQTRAATKAAEEARRRREAEEAAAGDKRPAKKVKANPKDKEKKNPKGGRKKSHVPGKPRVSRKKKTFEPCDNCKEVGHPELCTEHRPCANCVEENIQSTCNGALQYDHGFQSMVPPAAPPLDPNELLPYAYLPGDVNQLFDSRRQLGGLPVIRPDNFDDIIRAFTVQDHQLRHSDPTYLPIRTATAAEAYWGQQLAGLVNEMPPLYQDGIESTQGGFAEVPHTAAQELENFHGVLAIRQTNAYDPPQAFDMANIDPQLLEPQDEERVDRLNALDLYSANDDDLIMADNPPPDTGNNANYPANWDDFSEFINDGFLDAPDMMDARLAEPATSGPATQTVQLTQEDLEKMLIPDSEFTYPVTWHFADIREGYNMELEYSEGKKKRGHCTQDVNFWDPTVSEIKPCPAEDGVICDAWTCTDQAICVDCVIKQRAAVQNREADIVAKTKAWFCRRCKDNLDMERCLPGGAQPLVNRCYCVAQLQSTWICHGHRLAGVNELEKKMDEELALAGQDGSAGLCGHCRVNPRDPSSGAWKCICCSQVATLP